MLPDDCHKLLLLLSHELRSPLGVMRGYLRLLEQQGEVLPAQHRTAITKALKASDRAGEILAQVSTLAQLQRGEVALALEPVAIPVLIDAVAAAVTLPDDPVVTLEVERSIDARVNADGALLRQVLSTLTAAVVRAQAMTTTVCIRTTAQVFDGRDGIAVMIAPATAAHGGVPVTRGVRGGVEEVPATRGGVEDVIECDLDISRGGLGLDLPLAATVLTAHGGRVRELRRGDRYVGVVVWLPRLP